MNRRILFTDAPFGPFLRALVPAVEQEGGVMKRLVLDGGDLLETQRRARVPVPRGGALETFVERLIEAERIDTIVTFNDHLPRHAHAHAIAARRGLRRFVIENGLLRPHFVTLEGPGAPGATAPETFPLRLVDHVRNAAGHFLAAEALRPLIPYDRTAYGVSVPRQGFGYVREGMARLLAREDLDPVLAQKERGGRVAVFFLQKPGDSQITRRSPFGDVAASLRAVLSSFAIHAPADVTLLVKQHPLDPGFERLSEIFSAFGFAPRRARFLRKAPLSAVLALADAVVTVNSSTGIEAIASGLAVKCLGTAVYDRPGLTDQQPLDGFWRDPKSPDAAAVDAFLADLRATTQMNGGFHTALARAILIPALARRLCGDP